MTIQYICHFLFLKEMFDLTEIIKLMEIAGTIAFSVSGAAIACSAGLDVFGVVFIGCITAFGGGIMRDIILGINPPMFFLNYAMFFISVICAITVFIINYVNREKMQHLNSKIEFINNLFDAIGLASFSVIGAEVVFGKGYSDNALLVVTMGMLTGIGGGIIRDIMINKTPYVFKKHVYALASICGSLLYYALKKCIGTSFASAIAVFVVIVIRILAMKFRWSLPKVHDETLKLQTFSGEKVMQIF